MNEKMNGGISTMRGMFCRLPCQKGVIPANPLRHKALTAASFLSTHDKNHRNRLIPVIFSYNLQLFEMLNFRRFIKTHTLTYTGKGPESTGQGQTGIFLFGPIFFCCIYRICWLMTPPMASAASCFIWAVA